MTLAAEVAGRGPALVLLHGFTGSPAAWQPLLPALTERFTTVAIALPGHDRSPLPPPDAGLPEVADALVATLDRLGIGQATWLGYSLGGRAALHVALAHPTRVGRLVLESASPGIDDAAERRARAADDLALAETIVRDGVSAFVDRWLAQPLFATQARLPPAVRARARAGRLVHAADGLAAALRSMSVGRQASLWPRLAEITMPTLLVVGADDPRYRAHAAAMAARLPQAEVTVVPAAGHAVHLENPTAWTAAVSAFLTASAP